MKELSSLDLHFLTKEFQLLVSAKVEQIYQSKDEFLIQFHIPGQGKSFLRLINGNMIYLAHAKPVMPERPPSFCLFMRKKLKNARLRAISQIAFERVLKIVFETKEQVFNLYFEIFSTGNIILCDADDKILSATDYQVWKDRSIKRNENYVPPSKWSNILSATDQDIRHVVSSSDKETVVKTLAIDFSLGGKYSEEVCVRAKVDKNLSAKKLSDDEVGSIISAIRSLLSDQVSPRVVFDDKPRDITPFPLRIYSDLISKDFDSFNHAIDSVLTEEIHKENIDVTKSESNAKISKVQQIISEQEQRIAGLETSEKENQRKGELIYENYAKIDEILKEIQTQRANHSLRQIRDILIKNKIIKSLDEKTGDVVIEIG